jgi:hypothetical protein
VDITQKSGLSQLPHHAAVYLVKFGKFRHLGGKPRFPELFETGFFPDEDFASVR